MSVTLGAWLHAIDPFLLRISGDIGVRWYGLAYIAGFLIAYLMMRGLAKRGLIQIPFERVADAMLILIVGTLVGGRLVYVLVYDRSLLTSFSSGFPFWGVFAINRGGMASHGGMVGVIAASWRVSRGWKLADGRIIGRTSWLHVLDITTACCTVGLGLGRVANFINGELLGKVKTPAGVEGPWWTVQFPQELTHFKINLNPDQSAKLDRLLTEVAPGLPYNAALDRLITRAATVSDQLKPLLTSRHPSQLYQAIAEGVILTTVLWLIWARPRKPGVVGCWFMIIYGVLRILTEFRRLPDAQFGDRANTYGLSMGQWLSVGMIGVGLAVLIVSLRRPVPKLGGWLRREQPTSAGSTMHGS